MIVIRDDFVQALLSVMAQLKADPGASIDNEGIRAALLRQASSTPDNEACSEHIEFAPEAKAGHQQLFGLKIAGKDVFLSEIAWGLECDEVVDLVAARRPELSREDIEAALRVNTLLLSGLEVKVIDEGAR